MASAFLAKALRSLMSAKRAEVMGGSLKETEAPLASVTDRRPTRWMVLRAKTKALRSLQLSGAVRPPAHCVRGAGASMSAKRAEVMGGALKETEAPLASVTDRRPTQWVVLRCRVESAMLSAAN